MNAVCLNSTKLINYILPRLEISTRTVFRQSDLQKVSGDQFRQLKNEGYLIEEYRDYRRTTFVDEDGIRRFIRKVKDTYWGYSQDSESPGRIPLTPEYIKYFRFDIIKFAGDLQRINNLSGKVSRITDQIVFIGTTNSGQQTGVFMGLFEDDHQASAELLSLRSQAGYTDNILVICPIYECPQDLLSRLNHQGIDCAKWLVLMDEDGRIQYRSDNSLRLKFLNETSGKSSYCIELNNEKISIPSSEMALLIYMAIKLIKGDGYVTQEDTDREGITESEVTEGHLRKLVYPLKNSLRRKDLILNKDEGSYKLTISADNIHIPRTNWLEDTLCEILAHLEKHRERRAEQKSIQS